MKKKKIAIITFHKSNNCGSLLQAYALQTTLEKGLNMESELLNFSNKNQKEMYSIMPKINSFKSFIKFIMFLPFYFILKKHDNDYKSFVLNNLKESKKEYEKISDFDEKIEEEYDKFITGSDQVWNYKAYDFDIAYLLPFVKSKDKIAYAVSLGASNITECDKWNEYKKYIESFKDISVRENNAKQWLSKSCDKNINICLDPTLLLNNDDYDNIIDKEHPKEKYIFWYCMIYNKKIAKKIQTIAQKYNVKVYVIDANEWIRRSLYTYGIKLWRNSGPSAYLSMVKNAEIVITSSFHGTVFCYMFKKNFWYINIHRGKTNDDRASFLLKQLNLEDRMISIDEITTKDLKKTPVYKFNILEDKKREAINFLEKNL